MQCPPSSLPNYASGDTTAGEPFPPWNIKIVMPCLQTILRDESQSVGNNPLRSSSPTLILSNQPTLKSSTTNENILDQQVYCVFHHYCILVSIRQSNDSISENVLLEYNLSCSGIKFTQKCILVIENQTY